MEICNRIILFLLSIKAYKPVIKNKKLQDIETFIADGTKLFGKRNIACFLLQFLFYLCMKNNKGYC